jgi:hypothetical protein
MSDEEAISIVITRPREEPETSEKDAPEWTALDELEERANLAFYRRLGLDSAGVDCLTRLAAVADDPNSDMAVVSRHDLKRILVCLGEVGDQREREIPVLKITDDEYIEMVEQNLSAALRVARGVTPQAMDSGLEITRSHGRDGTRRGREASLLLTARRLAAGLAIPMGTLLTETAPGADHEKRYGPMPTYWLRTEHDTDPR